MRIRLRLDDREEHHGWRHVRCSWRLVEYSYLITNSGNVVLAGPFT
ncbi:hypothetical protein [Algoriphagus hitonicola]